jgi:hypothetical protein
VKNPALVWSFGGGVQSAAIAVLIRLETLPKPDFAVIADTGMERRTTWQYLNEVIQPYLDPVGVKIQIAPSSLQRVGVLGKHGLTPMPAFTARGKLPFFCSGEWKRDVVERWLRLQGVKNAVQWLGFSTEERHRATGKAHRPWLLPEYPLIDRNISRDMCLKIVEMAGLPRPPKSRCYQCPQQSRQEWQDVLSDPVDGPLAVSIDEAIREGDVEHAVFLHPSRKPLRLVSLDDPGDDFPLFRECKDGGCFT